MTWVPRQDWSEPGKVGRFDPTLTWFIDRDFTEYYLGGGKWSYQFHQGDKTIHFDEQYAYDLTYKNIYPIPTGAWDVLTKATRIITEDVSFRGCPLSRIIKYLISKRPENQLQDKIDETVRVARVELERKLDTILFKYEEEFKQLLSQFEEVTRAGKSSEVGWQVSNS